MSSISNQTAIDEIKAQLRRDQAEENLPGSKNAAPASGTVTKSIAQPTNRLDVSPKQTPPAGPSASQLPLPAEPVRAATSDGGQVAGHVMSVMGSANSTSDLELVAQELQVGGDRVERNNDDNAEEIEHKNMQSMFNAPPPGCGVKKIEEFMEQVRAEHAQEAERNLHKHQNNDKKRQKTRESVQEKKMAQHHKTGAMVGEHADIGEAQADKIVRNAAPHVARAADILNGMEPMRKAGSHRFGTGRSKRDK